MGLFEVIAEPILIIVIKACTRLSVCKTRVFFLSVHEENAIVLVYIINDMYIL